MTREAVARGARTSLIPRAEIRVLLVDLLAHDVPKVAYACRRLIQAIDADALRLATVRDVDVLLTHVAATSKGRAA
jgi:hypothetical protein